MAGLARGLASRPACAVCCLLASGALVLLLPSSRLTVLAAPGVAGATGLLVGTLLLATGVVLAIAPCQHTMCGMAGIVLALISFVTPSLGGLVVGMLLGLTGGAFALAWEPAEAGGRRNGQGRTGSSR